MGVNPRSTALETSTLTITPPMGGQTHDLPHRDEHANDYTADGGSNPQSTAPMGGRDEHANDYTTDGGSNPLSTALETSTITITPPMGGSNPRSTALETSTLTITPPMGGRTRDLPHSRRTS